MFTFSYWYSSSWGFWFCVNCNRVGFIMCYGKIIFHGLNCPYEVKSGPNWGKCEKPKWAVCPDSIPDTEDERIYPEES